MNRDQLIDLVNQPRAEFERRCSAGARHYSASETTIVARVLEQLPIHCLRRDLSLTPHLVLSGCWEPWVALAIGRHVKPGMRCMDIGANVGFYSVLMAGLGASVEAFEPYMECMKALRDTARVTGLPIDAFAYAIGAKKGSASLQTAGNLVGSAHIRPDSTGNIPLWSLDEFQQDDTKVDFIKIDAEGSERAIWQGMQELWTRSKNLVMCLEFQASFYGDEAAREFIADLRNKADVRKVSHEGAIVACDFKRMLDNNDFEMLWVRHKS